MARSLLGILLYKCTHALIVLLDKNLILNDTIKRMSGEAVLLNGIVRQSEWPPSGIKLNECKIGILNYAPFGVML